MVLFFLSIQINSIRNINYTKKKIKEIILNYCFFLIKISKIIINETNKKYYS